MQLSKTDYMLYLRHPAWLWLKKHDKNKLPPVDAALQAMFDDGHLFEEYAEKLFPHAIKVGFNMGEYRSYLTMIQRTKEVINNGDAKIILQGRVENGELTCIFDAIERTGETSFNLYEIKSSTEVKEDHIFDLAFQTIVLENAGLTIDKIYVIHVNREYVRNGKIDISEMTTQEEVTEKVREKIDETKESIEKALIIMKSDMPPDYSPRHVGLGALDEWMAIYRILFPLEHPHNIYKLTRINPKLIGVLEDLGINLIKDIPDNIKLNVKQQRQVKVTRSDTRIINKVNIKKFLDNIIYPVYFLDYETFSSVIPPFDGERPYQQVPFQYSIHIIEKPGSDVMHREFLHRDNSDPGIPLLTQLKKDIGESGSILVWYQAFEKGRNEEMGEMFPQYEDLMKSVNERVIDLMTPFYEGWFVDKDFFGSASIKKVLPVLVSELSYEKLNIKEGGEAQRIWMDTVFMGNNQDKKEEIMNDLLEYCKLDTLAMVQLFKFLQKLVLQ